MPPETANIAGGIPGAEDVGEKTAGNSGEKIGTFAFAALIVIALIFDLPELIATILDIFMIDIPIIEIIKWILWPIAALCIFISMKLAGIEIGPLAFLLAAIVKGVPILDGLPAWTTLVLKEALPKYMKGKLKGIPGGEKIEAMAEAGAAMASGNEEGAMTAVTGAMKSVSGETPASEAGQGVAQQGLPAGSIRLNVDGITGQAKGGGMGGGEPGSFGGQRYPSGSAGRPAGPEEMAGEAGAGGTVGTELGLNPNRGEAGEETGYENVPMDELKQQKDELEKTNEELKKIWRQSPNSKEYGTSIDENLLELQKIDEEIKRREEEKNQNSEEAQKEIRKRLEEEENAGGEEETETGEGMAETEGEAVGTEGGTAAAGGAEGASAEAAAGGAEAAAGGAEAAAGGIAETIETVGPMLAL